VLTMLKLAAGELEEPRFADGVRDHLRAHG
jgi:hypothetical protein